MNVSRETLDALDTFVGLLERWNTHLNLVSRASNQEIWTRHVVDSLQLLNHIPDTIDSFADVGSGGGFPGIPVAIATGMFAHLIEADQRKAAFLQVVVAELGIPARIWRGRAEDIDLPPQSLCTARAVGSLKQVVTLCRPLMMPGGLGLFPKGREYARELSIVQTDPTLAIRTWPSATDPEAAIVAVRFGATVRGG